MIILGLIIGLILMYFVLRPKLTQTKKIDKEIEEQNNRFRAEREYLSNKIVNLKATADNYSTIVNNTQLEMQVLLAKEKELEEHIQKTRETIDKDNEIIYQKSFDLMQENLSQAATKEAERYQEAQKEAEEQYLKVLEDIALKTAETLALKHEEVRIAEEQLANLRAKADAAIMAAKREEEKMLELDKYKLILTELDLLEINRLREIAPYFRNPRAIYKIIWESYYRNITNDLINRIIGTETKTGIYKITNLNNQKTYIGQSTDIAARLKEHIKCGLGLDAPNNILYSAMFAEGVENFSFEVIEECGRESLNDREIYWIDFYHSREYGYNMTRGGARK